MCALGLTACITLNGISYPKKDFYDIKYECGMAQSEGFFEEVSYILVGGRYRLGMQQGYLALEMLENKGVDFSWKPKGKIPNQYSLAIFRKKQLIDACTPFIDFGRK